MRELLLVERGVLEAISKGATKVVEIMNEVNIEFNLTLTILARLRSRGIITLSDGHYVVAKNELAWKKVNNEVEYEIKEVSENIIDCYFKDGERNKLKLQKVYMSSRDEKIFNSMLNNIEIFLRDLQKENSKKKNRITEQKVIFWGVSQYDDLIKSSLQAC